MSNTVPVRIEFHPARDLKPGFRVAAGFLPLMAAAEVLFAYRYTLHGVGRVATVYLYANDSQPQPDDHLAEAMIPVTSTDRADLDVLARSHPPVCAGCAYEALKTKVADENALPLRPAVPAAPSVTKS